MDECLPQPCSLPLSSLRLLVSPLQLMSAALWGIVQHRAVKHYGLLEDFITVVQDHIPGALTYSERVHIILGLRAKVVLEMCKYEDLCYRENIEPHLKKMYKLMEQADEEIQSKMKVSFGHFSKVIYSLLADPHKRNVIYQKMLPYEFDLKFDSSMQTLIRKLLLHLEKLLPAPSLDQTSLWLELSPSVLKDCESILKNPELCNLIEQQKQNCSSSPGHHVDDLICPDLLTENNVSELQSLDIRVAEPQVTENTEDDDPSVEVTLCFDKEEENDNPNVTYKYQRQTMNESFRNPVCGLNFDTFQSFGKQISERSRGGINKKTIPHVILNSETNKTEESTKSNSHSDNIVCLLCGQVYTHATLLEHQKVCVVKYEQQKQTQASSSISLQQTKTSRNSKRYKSRKRHQNNICYICGKMFTSLNYLKSHIRTHEKDKEKSEGKETVMEAEQKGFKHCVIVIRRLHPSIGSKYMSCRFTTNQFGQNSLKPDLRKLKRRSFPKNPKTHFIANDLSSDGIRPCNVNSVAGVNEKKPSDSYSSHFKRCASTKERTIKCTLCDQTCSTMLLLKRHYYNVHRVKGSYECPSCKRSFLRLCEMVQHHNNKHLYQCETCKFYFTKPIFLKKHKEKFKNTCANPHICEFCGKSCINSAVLNQHLNKHKPKDEQTFCTICNKNFSDKFSLRVHMNRHTGGFPCSLCDKVLYQKTDFKRHMDKHNGTEPYLCEICGEGWPTPAKLKNHMLKHTEERPFKCDNCDKTFKSASKLNEHIKNHTNSWVHKCDICGRMFQYSSALKYHKMKHTGVFPYNCPRCACGFPRMSKLKLHRKKVGH